MFLRYDCVCVQRVESMHAAMKRAVGLNNKLGDFIYGLDDWQKRIYTQEKTEESNRRKCIPVSVFQVASEICISCA